MSKRKTKPAKKARPRPQENTYRALSQQPLQILLFLLPLLALYELATFIALSTGDNRDIRARSIIRFLFDSIGVTGLLLPGVLVVLVLLIMHGYRKDRWRFLPRMYGMMWVESLVLALPILAFALIMLRSSGTAATLMGGAQDLIWIRKVVFSVGAGIYEELLFRLIGIALIHLLLIDVLALPDYIGELAAIGVTALLFAAYHFTGNNAFRMSKFAFYTLAGLYLASIYIYRGFGIAAGTHAMYDVLAVTLAEVMD